MRLAVFVLILPLALACDDTESTGPIVPVEEATVTTTSSLRFSPATVNLEQGGTITWAFNGVGHNVVFDVPNAPQGIPITFSSQVARTFPNSGSFPYHCQVHGAGMSGTIIVHAP